MQLTVRVDDPPAAIDAGEAVRVHDGGETDPVPTLTEAVAEPVPDALVVKRPGAVVATFTVTPFEVWPRNFTNTVALVNCASSYGTTAETCVALA